MKKIILALATTLLPVTAMANPENNRAQRIAKNLVQDLRDLAMESRSEADQSSNGHLGQIRARKFNDIAKKSRQAAMTVRSELLPAIRNDRQRQMRRAMQKFNQKWQALSQSFNSVHLMPYDIKDLYSDASTKVQRLKRALQGGGNEGQRRWKGSCRVVLETVWGTDLRDFYGKSVANSKNMATQEARQDGQSQCQAARRGPLQKCTVASECNARPFGHF